MKYLTIPLALFSISCNQNDSSYTLNTLKSENRPQNICVLIGAFSNFSAHDNMAVNDWKAQIYQEIFPDTKILKYTANTSLDEINSDVQQWVNKGSKIDCLVQVSHGNKDSIEIPNGRKNGKPSYKTMWFNDSLDIAFYFPAFVGNFSEGSRILFEACKTGTDKEKLIKLANGFELKDGYLYLNHTIGVGPEYVNNVQFLNEEGEIDPLRVTAATLSRILGIAYSPFLYLLENVVFDYGYLLTAENNQYTVRSGREEELRIPGPIKETADFYADEIPFSP